MIHVLHRDAGAVAGDASPSTGWSRIANAISAGYSAATLAKPVDHDPSPQRVARRGIVLYAIATRAVLDAKSTAHDTSTHQINLLAWLDDLRLGSEIEPDESRILHAPIGRLSQEEVARCYWRYEGAAVLAWALGRLSLPGLDAPVRDTVVGDAFADLDPNAQQVLRPSDVIQNYEDVMYNVHWRICHFFGRAPASYNLRRMLADYPGIPDVAPMRYIDDDLAVDDVALPEATLKRASECCQIITERRHALSWLCGDDELYSRVPLDT